MAPLKRDLCRNENEVSEMRGVNERRHCFLLLSRDTGLEDSRGKFRNDKLRISDLMGTHINIVSFNI